MFNAARTDILIERLSHTEHLAHIFDVAGVPESPADAAGVGVKLCHCAQA